MKQLICSLTVSTANTQVNPANSINIDNLSDVVICSFFSSQPNSPQLTHEDLQQIHPDDIEKMDLRWQMAMLTMRARRFLKNTGRKLTVNGNETISLIVQNGAATNAYEKGHFGRRMGPNLWLTHLQVLTQSLNNIIDFQIVDNCKKGLGYENYNAVPPPYTGNFMPPTPDLSFTGLDEFVNKPVIKNCKAISSEEEPKVVRKCDDSPIIEEWVLDDEEEDVSQPKTKKKIVRPIIVKKEFVKSKQQKETARKTVKQGE
ncbi:hypothetical protein Tco_0077937 [Tanacetum coccineum]